jgi:cytochrome P450
MTTQNNEQVIHPPGPNQALPARHVFAMALDTLNFLTRSARYGDVVRLTTGMQETYLLNHPDLIRTVLVTNHRSFTKSPVLQRMRVFLGQGLLTSEGDLHLRQRRLIQPAFHRERVNAYGEIMTSYSRKVSQDWQPGETRDIHEEMMRLTMVIVGHALFGTDVEGEAAEIGEAITVLLGSTQRLVLPFWSRIQHLPLPGNRRINEAGLLLDEKIREMIGARRAAMERGEAHLVSDLMDMLLRARDEEGDGGGMSDQLIRDEALTLFLAGHETTANALTWTWYLLSQHPEVEQKLHAELESALGGRTPTAEDVENLPYTRMVLSESMRLYPPAWILGRQAKHPVELGGYTLPEGAVVVMSQWLMHRDERFYPDPLRFDPQRWTPEAQSARPRLAYFPFGAGPRLCVGEPFAWMEGILILADLAQRWRLRLAPGQKIELLPQITLRPKHGMRMVLERRE